MTAPICYDADGIDLIQHQVPFSANANLEGNGLGVLVFASHYGQYD